VSPRVRHWLKVAALIVLSATVFLLFLDLTGLPAYWMRRAVVRRIAGITGGGVELGDFQFSLWRFRAELYGLTIHGSEPPGSRPYFHATYVLANLRLVSLLGRRVALDELRMDHPALSVRILRDGMSNAPHPVAPVSAPQPLREELFALSVGRLQIVAGEIRWNDGRSPLALDSEGFRFLMHLDSPTAESSVYRGELSAKKLRLQAGPSLPFLSDLDVRFSLARDSFSLDEFTWRPPHSEIRGRAALASFVRPSWTFSYQANLDFRDVRELLRVPAMPDGRAQTSGEGRWAPAAAGLSGRGEFTASGIELPYPWFHAAGLSSRGRYELQHDRLVVPDFHAEGLGGKLDGHLEMLYTGLRFRMESELQEMSLAAILGALNHPGFPVATLHWESRVAVHSVTTWDANFLHLDSRGTTAWTPPPPAA
jgi:hypothetical protein